MDDAGECRILDRIEFRDRFRDQVVTRDAVRQPEVFLSGKEIRKTVLQDYWCGLVERPASVSRGNGRIFETRSG